MSIIVQKYGGSSVATPEKIKQVAARVARTYKEGHKVVVVVSAMGNTTDDLLKISREITPSPSRRELDMLLSVGERISVALLSMAIHAHGIDAISFTGSQSGIITTASHSQARIIEVRPYRIQDELAEGKIVIVAGYQGVSYRREITTLGRGGSDTTAVALAGALNAEACEIYSDVDGVYSSDPRIIPNAERLEAITYEEMQEMARLGAKVLNATAVEFARRAGIALYARATQKIGDPGTRVHSGGGFVRVDGFQEDVARAERNNQVRAISGIQDGYLFRGSNLTVKSLSAVLEEVQHIDAPLCDLDHNSGRLSLFVDLDDVHDLENLQQTLENLCGESTLKGQKASLVSAIGVGVGRTPRVLSEAVSALLSRDISVGASRASGPSVSLVVNPEDLQNAMQTMHLKFVEEA